MKRVGIVLCGGRSSRMGRAKAWLPWFGRSMLEHVVGSLAPAVDEVLVVTSRELDLPPLPARIVEDREPDRGPLAGIRDGLEAAGADLAFVTSTDSPFLTTDFVREMLEHGSAAAPVAEGYVQVLSAVYPGDAWKQADILLAAGRPRALTLLEELDYQALDFAGRFDGAGAGTQTEEGGGRPPWQGFNSPAEYLDAAREVDRDAQAEIELLGRAALAFSETRFERPIGILREVLGSLPSSKDIQLVDGDRVARGHLVSLGGRDLVRRLDVPVGPGERISVIDSQAGG